MGFILKKKKVIEILSLVAGAFLGLVCCEDEAEILPLTSVNIYQSVRRHPPRES